MEHKLRTLDNKKDEQKNELFILEDLINGEQCKGQLVALQESKGWFIKLGPASLIYAMLFVICEYQNYASIMTPVWVVATYIYACYEMKRLAIMRKKESNTMLIVMTLLGISSFLTGNNVLHFLNIGTFLVILIYFLLYNFYDTRKWGYGRACIEIWVTIFGTIATIFMPFEDSMACFRLRKKQGGSKSYGVFIGIALALPFALLIGFCLVSADAVFQQMVGNLFQFSRIAAIGEDMVLIPMMLLIGFFSSYCGMRYLSQNTRSKREEKHRKQYSATIAISFLSIFAIMYLVFSVIQIVYLFLGFGNLPKGITYATYARTGFFQLLFVTIMNLVIVLTIKGYFEEHKLLTIMLYLVCLSTLVMIASSAYRMFLYISSYHLTFARVFVLVALVVISVLIIGIMIYLHNISFPLFRFSLYVICTGYVIFSLCHVDYWIAKYNIEHITKENQEDILDYMKNLSSDAAPIIIKYVRDNHLEEQVRKEVRTMDYNGYDSDYGHNWYLDYYDLVQQNISRKGFRHWNYSYWIASQQLFNPLEK